MLTEVINKEKEDHFLIDFYTIWVPAWIRNNAGLLSSWYNSPLHRSCDIVSTEKRRRTFLHTAIDYLSSSNHPELIDLKWSFHNDRTCRWITHTFQKKEFCSRCVLNKIAHSTKVKTRPYRETVPAADSQIICLNYSEGTFYEVNLVNW